ncbi:MAG: cytidylate kinase-like family protein [Eubacteriales bacterium]|nr:cytidylate kinase-like family protein [Eubacteriales bacterium]
MIVTLGRQHGSNGHLIARRLAEELGYKCYDKEIVDEAAAASAFSKEIFDSYDEKRVSAYILSTPHYIGMNEGFHLNMQVAAAQFETMRRLAEKGDCIFVGRCADYVLRNRDDVLRIFIMGDMETRIKTMMERRSLSYDQARRLVREVDKDRSSYYKYHTDQIWGESENYDLCIDSRIGVQGTVDVIRAYMAALEK